jgi:hypothetical protein
MPAPYLLRFNWVPQRYTYIVYICMVHWRYSSNVPWPEICHHTSGRRSGFDQEGRLSQFSTGVMEVDVGYGKKPLLKRPLGSGMASAVSSAACIAKKQKKDYLAQS